MTTSMRQWFGVGSELLGNAAGIVTEDALARMIWLTISEPGDFIRHRMIAAFGAVDALMLVADAVSADQVLEGIDADDLEDEYEQVRSALCSFEKRLSMADPAREVTEAIARRAQLVVPGQSSWPQGLDDLGERAPVALWGVGPVEVDPGLPRVAVVGSRAATGYGEHVTSELVVGMAPHGTQIISGGAYGIDAVAHRAALAEGGETIAVMAGGLGRLYPVGNKDLLERIAGEGLVLSEASMSAPPTRHRFQQRQRLLAALSQATVVVEAGARSGSLKTASDALELGRAVGAVPGPLTSGTSVGAHTLIRRGTAALVTTGEEVLDLI